MKIWLVHGNNGYIEKAFWTKKEAVKFANEENLLEWWKSETGNPEHCIQKLELEKRKNAKQSN